MLFFTRTDALNTTLLSTFISSSHGGTPEIHHDVLNDVHYYLSPSLQTHFPTFGPHTNSSNTLLISGTNFFPLPGVYKYPLGEGTYRIYSHTDGKLWGSFSPSGSSSDKYKHPIVALRTTDEFNLYTMKIFCTQLLLSELPHEDMYFYPSMDTSVSRRESSAEAISKLRLHRRITKSNFIESKLVNASP